MYEPAVETCREAVRIMQQLGDRVGEASTWDSLGFAHAGLGHHPDAIKGYERAIRLFEETSNHYYQADSLVHLGDSYRAVGDTAAARQAWSSALAIFEDLDHPDAAQTRARLGAC